ncbi:MAG: lipopolysaccharide biosynthesis protein [Acidihalobacter sp.]|uniref:lipopolysaccharide biosynthesis protein n=1 Tax=Acidihalobacter sp. TaxID=1872108 RepID=UPI00307CC971
MGRLFKSTPAAFNDIPETGVDAGWQDLGRGGSVVSRTAFGAAWIIIWRFVNRFLGIISTLILARLLLPADFGVVALAMSFVQGLQQLAELGTENAIIRADMPDRQLYNTGFTINVLRGVGVGCVLAVIAVPAGGFFNTPHFTQVALLAALVSVVSSFQNIGVVDYRRYMAFDREFLLKLVPRLLSVTTAVTLAFVLRDYWALIIAILVNVCADVLLSYVMHPYRPRFTLAGWPRMASYSTLLWLSNIAGLLGTLGTRSTITKMTNVSSLGLYELASEIANLPTTELTGPLTRAMFSGLSEVRNQADRGAGLLLRMMTTMNVIVLPIGVGLSLVAEPTVRLAFGEKWQGAVPLLQILALGEAISIFGQMSRQAFAVHGWMKALLKVTLVFGLSQIAILIVMILMFGMPGIALALIVGSIANGLVYFVVTMSRLQISWRVLLSRVWRSFVAAMLMTAALNAAGFGWFDLHTTSNGWPLAWQLCEIIALGTVTYSSSLLVLWLLAGRPDGPERELLNCVRSYIFGRLARQR